mmetsp:Transcript_80985/g.216215  ORF Transcript_80985/g.216215 Transcript_80985/m.216215 type:complete len:240 (+) Transcript_80985:194-913(+)
MVPVVPMVAPAVVPVVVVMVVPAALAVRGGVRREQIRAQWGVGVNQADVWRAAGGDGARLEHLGELIQQLNQPDPMRVQKPPARRRQLVPQGAGRLGLALGLAQEGVHALQHVHHIRQRALPQALAAHGLHELAAAEVGAAVVGAVGVGPHGLDGGPVHPDAVEGANVPGKADAVLLEPSRQRLWDAVPERRQVHLPPRLVPEVLQHRGLHRRQQGHQVHLPLRGLLGGLLGGLGEQAL